MNVTIEKMITEHWQEVRAIYCEGIAAGNATLEADAPSLDTWHEMHLEHSRLVASDGGKIIGWAALSPVSDRCVYSGVAEVTIYIAGSARGKGVGKTLLSKLICDSEEHGIWTLQAGMFPENKASIALHETCGFHKVGLRERLGQLGGVWRDILLLERRSAVVGC